MNIHLKEIFNTTIMQFGEYSLTVSAILLLLFFAAVLFLFLVLINKTIARASRIDAAKKNAVFNLVKYVSVAFFCVISLQILGFNISVLIASSAALFVGVGLGLQYLFSDFISGVVLLADSVIKVGDVIEVNNLVCKVLKINLRTTTVLTRDDKYIILPNSDLTRNQIINWTHSDVASRFEVIVSVDYASDVTCVMKLLVEAAGKQEGILKAPPPFVRFSDFGDSALQFSVFFWSEEVFRVENIKSEMRVRIFKMFAQEGIKIPFPQRVIHMKE